MMREPELKPKMPQKRPLDILFVEDNTADVDLSLREFKKAELEVHADVVQTAQEFVERLSAKAYDVVLADYRLPGWTGMDALELLRQQGKEIPFILVTGALGEEMAVECVKRGVADYILKDRLVRLPVAICRVLEEKYLRDARLWAETVLQESKARFRTLTETIASAIFIHQGTECRYVNRAAEAITGYSREELLAMSSWDLVHPDSRKLVMEQGLARLRGEQTPGRFEIKILTKQGEARWLDVTVAMIEYNGRPAGLTTAFDITERKRAEDEVRHLVASDPLTGLANYRRLLEVFDAEAKRSKRTGRPFALLLLDLDGLKKINDAQGHLAGSRALCRLANVLRLHCRAIDIAARHGGDEFAVILPETAMEAAQQVARRISERLANDGEQPPLSVSIGAASYPQDGETIDQLLGAADRALYKVKASIGETGSLPSLARGAPSI